MIITQEISLKDFEFWGNAIENAKKLTDEELEQVDNILSGQEELWNATELNDLFWFQFATVCDWLGLDYDYENDEIRRE